ncbi:aromatic ring-opening dioxygenase LigA [Streptomyces sp. CB02488]|uniref:FG-GAP-like repeat-containing protein n=1 Tax=Streptomyces sp. CB02488 TaxID=1703920 RepID=UPI00093C8ECB|nr:FG-GAP-like repeat-containing protein [Streptomyces sp. CB02488]OKK14885.1 aromatic ring-opening dioxygenase LigA [Streptomyces sp. CB02488]
MARHLMACTALATAVAAGALVAPAAFAAPVHGAAASSKTPRKAAAPAPGDVDGDGFGDLAAGSPEGTIKGYAKAGYVSLVYGTDQGVRVTRHKGITQDTAGIPGVPEAGDRFGSSVAMGDVDGDGYTDLVIGSGGEAIGTVAGAGAVTVVFGAKGGLGSDAIAFHNPKPSSREAFGDNLTVGDFDHDGRDDIAVATDTKVNVVRGASNLRDVAKPAMTAYAPPGGGAGMGPISSGDINGDGYTDLVTQANFDDGADEGTLGVLPGSAQGLKTQPIGRVGLPFNGYSVVTGDITGDGRDDVVVDTNYSDGPDEFLLRMFPGTAAGLGAGVPYGGAVEPGSVGVLADTDGDGHADLVTTVIDEPDSDGIQNAGALTVVPGTTTGLDAARARKLTLDSPGVMGVMEGNDQFGWSVTAGDFDADGRADLAVGAPGKYLATGAISVIPGSKTGPTGTGSILFTPESLGHPAAKARFGSAVSARTAR